jgi:hypothetical protein
MRVGRLVVLEYYTNLKFPLLSLILLSLLACCPTSLLSTALFAHLDLPDLQLLYLLPTHSCPLPLLNSTHALHALLPYLPSACCFYAYRPT